MSLQELAQAFQMFQDGMSKFATAKGINQAHEAVTQLKNQQLDQLEERKGMSAIANQLTMQLTAAGASPQQIAQAGSAIAPAPIKNSGDAFMEGALAGKQGKSLLDLAEQARKFDAKTGVENREDVQAFQAEQNALDRSSAETKKSQPRVRGMTQAEIKDVSVLKYGEDVMGGILSAVDSDPKLAGILAGRIPLRGKVDSKYAALKMKIEQQFNAYRQQITGAAASDKEIERLKEAMPNLTDSPSEFRAKAKVFSQLARQLRNTRLKGLDDAGVHIGKFTYDDDGNEIETSAVADEPAASPGKRPATKYIIGN
jgi:hypothetical protein